MSHPLEAIPPAWEKKVFWGLVAASLAIMLILNFQGAPLITPAAPLGIVSFELAGSPAQTQAILDSWDQIARQSAAFSLGFDYVFMLAYSAALALGCLMAGKALRHAGWPLAGLAAPLAWGQGLAALFDAVENLALVICLFSGPASPWPELARWCALIKFGLILLGLAYAILGLAAWLAARLRHER